MEAIHNFFTICWNNILAISISDILDVAIIAYLIYQLISFVKRTSSFNVIKGVILLVCVLWLSSLLKLTVVSYLLGEAFKIGVISLVVLFQPELRRLLEHFGSGSSLGFFGSKADKKDIELAIHQTVTACQDMSSQRVGALIVFERQNNLDGYINSGTIIDAEPTAELLKNIFYPKTPLHDGAVIIRNARIAGAACMLPLTNKTNLSRDLGMRHRAGIGMCERTDAVVIIVSEETGAISLAVDGMLKHQLTGEMLEMMLCNELVPVQESKGWRFRKKESKANTSK